MVGSVGWNGLNDSTIGGPISHRTVRTSQELLLNEGRQTFADRHMVDR